MTVPEARNAPEPLTAEERIEQLEDRVHLFTRKMMAAVVAIALGFLLTGWQISEAFDSVEEEREARVGASASINTFLCQRIDDVGNGVAALVRISLRNSPPQSELTPAQRLGYQEFLNYAVEQERPPRCRELALKIATLTGGDPDDIEITRIRLHPERPQNSRRNGPSTNP